MVSTKLGLDLYYQLAQEALDVNDIEQAIEISNKGLKEAKSVNSEAWIQKFDSFQTRISSSGERHFIGSISKKSRSTIEDLTAIKGIGSMIAKKLHDGGFRSIHDIVSSSAERLSRIPGIGLPSAQRLIDNAINHANGQAHVTNLNNFSGTLDSLEKDDKIEDVLMDELSLEGDEPEIIRPDDNRSTRELGHIKAGVHRSEVSQQKIIRRNKVEDPDDSNEGVIEDDLFDDKVDFKVDFMTDMAKDFIRDPSSDLRINQNVAAVSRERSIPFEIPLEQDEISAIDEVDEYNYPEGDGIIENFQDENLSTSEYQEMLIDAARIFRAFDYQIIEDTSGVHEKIDMLGVKIVKIHENLNLIFIIPIKISDFKGSLKISKDFFEYDFFNQAFRKNESQIKLIVNSYFNQLHQCSESVFESLVHETQFFHFFKKFLNIDMTVKNTLLKKKLFFHSGSLQYKFLIEPILILKNRVTFMEKTIPFAYHKHLNIHIIELLKLSDLLNYLEHKYSLTESYKERDNIVQDYFSLIGKNNSYMRLTSIPFFLFELIVMSLLMSQLISLPDLLLKLGSAIFGVYVIVLLFFYLRVLKINSEAQKEFLMPYQKKKQDLDETTMTLINEEFPPELMMQFSYECLGKHLKYDPLSQLEIDQAKDLLNKKDVNEPIEPKTQFEGNEILDESEQDDDLIKKYNRFLED